VNCVALIGRLTRDPEVRYIPETQMAVATFSIAIDRVSKAGKEKQADFPRITVFGKQAENCEKYITKGRLVGIQGRLQTGSYKNKDGATVYTTEVVAERVEFLDWGEKGGSLSHGSSAGSNIPEGFQALEDDDVPF
jgi:single-strand DNA-binding protein